MEAVGFVGVAVAQIGQVGVQFAIGAHGGSQFVRHRGQVVGDAQRAIEATGVDAVLLQGQAAVKAQGLDGHVGGDVGVAVAVAADPRGEGQEVVGRAQGGVVLGQRVGHVIVDGGQHVPQGVVEVEQAGAHFVGDGRAGGAAAVGDPQQGDFGRQPFHQRGALGREQVAHVEIGQGGGDAAQLGQNGAAFGLGGVGGEDEVDAQAVEELAHLELVNAGAVEGGHSVRHRFGHGLRVGVALPLAQDADAVLLFGQVDQLEVGGEAAGDEFGFGRVELADDGGQASVDGRVGLHAPGLGQGADALFQLEDLDARLPPDDVAEDVAEEVDVFA